MAVHWAVSSPSVHCLRSLLYIYIYIRTCIALIYRRTHIPCCPIWGGPYSLFNLISTCHSILRQILNIYLFVYGHICLYIFIYIYICVCACVCVRVCVCVCVCVHVCGCLYWKLWNNLTLYFIQNVIICKYRISIITDCKMVCKMYIFHCKLRKLTNVLDTGL